MAMGKDGPQWSYPQRIRGAEPANCYGEFSHFGVRSVLLTLGLSVVIAYVLLPVARLLVRAMPWRHNHPGLARGTAVGAIYLAGLAALAAFLITVIPPTVDQGRQFGGDFPEFLNGARTMVEGWVEQYVDVVSQDIRDEIEEALADAGDIVGNTAWSVVEQTLGIITGSFSFILALATAPVLVFYPDEGLQPHHGVTARPTSRGPAPLLPGPAGHRGPHDGGLHSRAARPGVGRRDHCGRGAAGAGHSLCRRTGHHRPG